MEYTWPSGARGGSQPTTRKETGPQPDSHKELNSANYLNKPVSRFSPRASRQGPGYQYLDFGLVRPRSKKPAKPI